MFIVTAFKLQQRAMLLLLHIMPWQRYILCHPQLLVCLVKGGENVFNGIIFTFIRCIVKFITQKIYIHSSRVYIMYKSPCTIYRFCKQVWFETGSNRYIYGSPWPLKTSWHTCEPRTKKLTYYVRKNTRVGLLLLTTHTTPKVKRL